MPIHIATSREVAFVVRRAMRVPVCAIADGWLMGPSVWDLDANRCMRVDFWQYKGHERARFLAPYRQTLATLAGDEPVVVWASPSWNDRVALFALCSHRRAQRGSNAELSLVSIGEHRHAQGQFGIGYVSLTPEMARDAWQRRRSLSQSEVREKASFWKRLTAQRPILSGRRVRETPSRKELVELGIFQAGHFPRAKGEGIFLSTLDTRMLELLTHKPVTPPAMFMRPGKKGNAFREWFDLIGDVYLVKRLFDWAQLGAVSTQPHTTPHGVQTVLCTITPLGESLLRNGLPTVSQAPPLPIWGVTAYDAENPWVVVEEAGESSSPTTTLIPLTHCVR